MPKGKPVLHDGRWDKRPAKEPRLDRDQGFVDSVTRGRLRDWWLAVPEGANTPNWDLAATCEIEGTRGLLLVEAKAHVDELSRRGGGSGNPKNQSSISAAIAKANTRLGHVVGGQWGLTMDSHYQLANRLVWSWKLASLGIPVVLVYLGFLHASDMVDGKRTLLTSERQWRTAVMDHGRGFVDEGCWGPRHAVGNTPLRALIRTYDQPFLRE